MRIKLQEKHQLIGLLLLALSILYYVFLGWGNSSPPINSDSIRYIVMANAILTPSGEMARGFFTQYLFPPLYPLTLSVFGGGDNIPGLYFVTSLFFAVSLFGVYLFLTREKLSPIIAGLLTCAIAASPAIIFQAFQVMSESLYMALSILCIYLTRDKDTLHIKHYVMLAAFLCGLALLTRTAGIVLVVALIAHLFYFRYPGRFQALAIILIPNLFWMLVKYFLFPTIGYVGGLFKIFQSNTFTQIMLIPYENIISLWIAWVEMFSRSQSLGVQLVLFPIFLFSFIGFYLRLKKLKLDATYVFLYMGMILIWPYPAESVRFITVIFPFLIFYSFIGLQAGQKRFTSQNYFRHPIILPLIYLLILTPPFYEINKRLIFEPIADEILAKYRKSRYWITPSNHTKAMEEIEVMHRVFTAVKALPEYIRDKNACVYFIIPSFISYHTGIRADLMPYHDKKKLTEKDFPDCDYIFSTKIITQQDNFRGMYPFETIDKSQLKPIFISKMEDEQLVAALTQLKRQATSP